MENPIDDRNSGYRLVAVLNKRIETSKVMNALAHAVAGAISAAGDAGQNALKFLEFEDSHGQKYPSISARSFVVLRGSEGELRKARAGAIAAGLAPVCFVETMTGGTYEEQLLRTKATPTSNLVFYAVVLLGQREELNPITKKLSLWRSETQEMGTQPDFTSSESQTIQ
jgi:hypothetical protein